MNYRNLYIKFIEKYRYIELNAPYERHHIIPKSCGGTDNLINIVKLPPRVHFFCHRLLVKIYTNSERQKMIFALHRMCYGKHREKYVITSRQYEHIRTLEHEANKMRIFSEQHRQNISKANKGKKKPTFSDEHRQNISKSRKGVKLSKEHKEKIRIASRSRPHRRGFKHTDEAKKKMSLSHKGKIPWAAINKVAENRRRKRLEKEKK